MAEMKDFTCRACGAQFDTRDRLDQHNRREHGVGQKSQGTGSGQYGERGTEDQTGRGYSEGGTQRGGQTSQSGQSGQRGGQSGQPGQRDQGKRAADLDDLDFQEEG